MSLQLSDYIDAIDRSQAGAVVPLDVNAPCVIDVDHLPAVTWLQPGVGIVHLFQHDARTGWVYAF